MHTGITGFYHMIDYKSLIFLMLIALLSACTASKTVQEKPNNSEPQKSKTVSKTKDSIPVKVSRQAVDQYKIGVDDIVQVSVWRNAELSVTVPVRPDGKISVPLIGDVQAGGMAPQEVAALIRKRLKTYIRNPNVTVILTELRSHEFLSRVRIIGAVVTPRSLPYRQGMTVLDAILEAGGVNEFAAANRTKIYRKHQNKTEVIKVKLQRILSKGSQKSNIQLLPGDIITVPERLF